MAGNLTKTERILLLMAAAFLAALAVLYLCTLKTAAGSDYTVTPQYQLEAPQLVNVNTADREELETLDGVGPALAQRIIDHREANGPFESVDELLEVSGIGGKTLAGFRSRVTVGS